MNKTKIEAIDALNDALSDLKGVSDALSLQSTVEEDDLAFALSRVLDADAEALRSAVEKAERPGLRGKKNGRSQI